MVQRYKPRGFPRDRLIGEGASIEAKAVETYFRDKVADEVRLVDLNRDYPHDPAACLVFMTDEAFAYFLPAFMRIALDDYQIAGSLSEAVVNRLFEMAEGRDDRRREAVLKGYSPEQLGAISNFLSEMSGRYWHRYPEDLAARALRYWESVGPRRT